MTSPLYLKMLHTFIKHPPKQNELRDKQVFDLMRLGPHCFDVTDAQDQIFLIAQQFNKIPDTADFSTTFLPAPITWIEYRISHLLFAFLIIQRSDRDIQAFSIELDQQKKWQTIFLMPEGFPLRGSERSHLSDVQKKVALHYLIAWAALSIINAPRGVTREIEPPHKNAVKAAKNFSEPFSLRPWTKIILADPAHGVEQLHDDNPTSTITPRAYHFCRSHLRIQNNRAVVVRSHWRGDASRGVVRSTYKIKANNRGAAS